jgi:hypothetical protein
MFNNYQLKIKIYCILFLLNLFGNFVFGQIYFKHYYPKVLMSNNEYLEIEFVDFADNSTRIQFKVTDLTKKVCISSESYLWDAQNAQKYSMIDAENINICNENNHDFTDRFTLIFEKLQPDCRKFHFFEKCNTNTCWTMYNINLNDFTPNRIRNQIKFYVEEKINEWQKKGEFEKTNSFLLRVNEKNRKLKIKEFEKEAIHILQQEFEKGINFKSASIGEYDADNETFSISIQGFEDIVVKVNISEAPDFKENWNFIKFKNLETTLTDKGFQISHLEFINPQENICFTFDSKVSYNYENTEIQYNFNNLDYVPSFQEYHISSNSKLKKVEVGIPDVDTDIPSSNIKQYHAYALIIGNEDYRSKQRGLTSEQNVDYATNDAVVFSQYCIKTLGIPSNQVRLLQNATAAEMNQAIAWLANLSKIENGNAKLIFYYSGHGLPHEQTKEAYLIPVDVSGINLDYAVKVNDIYSRLTEYPAQQITVFLDACFSGGARNEGLLAMRGVRIKPRENMIAGNLVVLSSSTGEESSAAYNEKQHGFFTYFLLKKLQETKGEATLAELSDYLRQSVTKASALEGKIQTPQVKVSPQLENNWGSLKLK